MTAPRKHTADVKVRDDQWGAWPPGESAPVMTWAENHYDAATLLVTLPDGKQVCVELATAVVRELLEDCEAARKAREAREGAES